MVKGRECIVSYQGLNALNSFGHQNKNAEQLCSQTRSVPSNRNIPQKQVTYILLL